MPRRYDLAMQSGEVQLSDAYHYPSQRMPVFASRCVATSQPLAAQVGIEIMRLGGNAVDAAIATAATLTVVEPTSNGLGSDAFALAWSGGKLHAMNASGRSGTLTDPEAYDSGTAIPRQGWAGVTVPGAISGWAELHRALGKLPFADLLQPATHYAREGFMVSPMTAESWARAYTSYPADDLPYWHQTFAPMGRPPRVGERFRLPDHAATLERIAASKGEAFYTGSIADAIEREAIAAGGTLRASDLASHTADWVTPIYMDYRGLRLYQLPPNGQGLAALIVLGILRRFDLATYPVDSPASLHLQIEAMKLGLADAHRYIADPAYMQVHPDALLETARLDEVAKRIAPDRAQDFNHGPPRSGGTVLLTAADDQGQMISFIQSNYMGFGSGVVIPGTGIAMQNRGCGFTTEPGHPNRIGPNKRPYHTIIPGFVTRHNKQGRETPFMAFGVMGGFMQPQGHVQVMVRIADYQQNPQAALDAPRWMVSEGLKVSIEPGLPAETYDTLRAMGHELSIAAGLSASHGRGQCILKLEDGYLAASDPRSDGQAVGF